MAKKSSQISVYVTQGADASLELTSESDSSLPTFEQARRALAAAKTTDDVLQIKSVAEAMRAYAREATDRTLEIDAVEIAVRAERKLGQLIDQQRHSVGLDPGGGDQRSEHRGVRRPGDRISYREAGIKKELAKAANRLAQIPEGDFERLLLEWRSEMVCAPRVMKLMRYQYNKECSERMEAEELAREKEAWIAKRQGAATSREELDAEWEKSQATSFDENDEYTTERRWSERQVWEARLASNPCAPDRPNTINSIQKIVADAITRLLALNYARPLRNPAKAADYERVLSVLDERIHALYQSAETSGS
jgi:hypothetical protein